MNKMIIPAVVIMAAAPVMVQAANFDIPANATCVADMSLELKYDGTLTFNNLDFVEIHYTTDSNRLSPELINVKIGDTTYSVEAEFDGDWVAKIPVKATNLAVNSIFVSIKGAGTITVKSATATTGVYQGLVTKYNALNEQLTELQAYPATKKVEKVYPTTEIDKLEQGLTDLKTWLDGEYTTGTNLEVASQYDTKAAALDVDQTVASIKADIDDKAKAIADANAEVAAAIEDATSEMTTLSSNLRTDYKDYTNDLTRALQAIQEQRTELANITTANGESLAAQTSDTDKDALLKRVEAVKTALAKIATDIADAKTEKDNAYNILTTQLQNGVTAQATDCPADFAFRTTSFTADVKAIESEIEAVKNTDDILTLDINAKLDAVNVKIATFNAAVAQAKAIKEAYNSAVNTINSVPSQIASAKNYINSRKTTCSYTDATNGLSYSKTLNLNGKGAELASYENSWKSNGTLITDLNSKWTAAKKLTYTELGATGYTSPVVTAATSIENQKISDLTAVSALQTAAQDLIDAYNAVFVEIKTVATSWTSAVNAAKGLMMYDKVGYTGFDETTSYSSQLAEQKTAINKLVSNAVAAASTDKTIAQMLAAVKALTNINGDSEWDTIAKAINALTDTQDAREAAFKTDELKAAKEAAEGAWKFYTQARTNAAFVAPTDVDASVLTNLEAQYNALVDQYEEYESYKNEDANVANYTTLLANFKKVSDGKAAFVNAVSAYIAALDKAQQAFAQNAAIYNAAVAAVQSAKTALGKTADNSHVYNQSTKKYVDGKYYGTGSSSVQYKTAAAYKAGRVATLADELGSLLSSINDANTACTLYDVWGHDAVKGVLQKQLDALNALIAKVDTDIDKAITLQNTANALEVESLKTGKETEVVAAWANDFTYRENEIATIKSNLQAQITSSATDKWVVDYEATFNTAKTKFDNNKAALKTNLETSQTRYNDRKTLITLVDAVQNKLDAAWISPDFDAIELYRNQLFEIESDLKNVTDFTGDTWSASKDYSYVLSGNKSKLEKYAGSATVEGSVDAIVALSKANLAAKTALDEKAAELTKQLERTIELLEQGKIEVTENGVTTTNDYTFETEEEKAKKEAALKVLNAFFNEAGEIFDANVAFSGKSVDAEILARYAAGQAATNQTEVENGILAFYEAINNVMVNLTNDYAGIVAAANEAVKTAFGTAYEANGKAYEAAIAELQKYQDLPAGDFRDQVMVSLTQAVTEITAVKDKADAKNSSFVANDPTLIDSDGYYDKEETAKKEIEGYTAKIGEILSAFTANVDALAVVAFDTELSDAKSAYETAKAALSGNEWTVTTTEFADVKTFIDDVQKAFNDAPTALNYGAQVNALNDTAKGYAALIAADKVKYADAQLEAYKKIGKVNADAAKTTVNGYKHLTDAHKSALISGIDGVLSAYETNLTKGVSDLWSGMGTVKTNSTGSYKYSNATLSISSTTTIDAFLNTITNKALDWDTADWNTTVVAGLQTELAKVSAIYTTLNGKGYAVLTDAADLYEGWDAAAGAGQKRTELQGQLNDLNTCVAGITNKLNATHDRTWLAEAEGEKGALRTQIADKYASLTGKNDIVAVFDAANSAYTTWKNNKVLEAYKASADVKAAVALAESWIPQNYRVEDTADYTAIVAKVNAVKAAIAAAKSAEEVDYLAFGKGTGTGDNIPTLLVVIDNHSNANTLVADMAADTKTAIEDFESALDNEKTKQARYEEGAKSNFAAVETALNKVNEDYTAALENGTLVFADVQQKMKDAVSTLTSELSTLASKAADNNTVLVKTKANEAGWTKVLGEYAEFEKVYEAAVAELEGYANVKANYTTTLANYLAAVKQALTSAENTYKAFNNSTNKLIANGLAENASIASTISQYERYIANLLQTAKAAQHNYDVQQACTRLAELNGKLATYWSTANNTLTNYNTTVQESFADEKQAVLDEMAEVKSNIEDGEYALANEAALTTQINDLYGKIDKLLALAADNNKGAAGTGDVDGNGKVTMNDYDTILNFILGEKFSDDADEQAKAEKAADVNNDDRVNVADLQGVLNIYHYGAWNRTSPQSNSRHRVAAYLNAAADNMEAEINGAQGVAEIALNLDNRQAYTSFQFDVKLPEGMQFDLVSLTERAEGLDVQTGLLEDGTIRVVATATDATIEAGTGAVARLNIATEGITDGEIVIENIVFADNYANAKTFNGFALTAGTVTGIAGNATLTQRVVRSIYNAGGQLMDKVQQGINIIVGENGTAKKVIKK